MAVPLGDKSPRVPAESQRGPDTPAEPVPGQGRASDKDLVVAFQAGDPSAFPEIYRRYRRKAEKVCRHHLPYSETEDAVQETMLRVLLALPAFNGSYALGAWIYRIATNVCVDSLRKRGRRNGEEVLDLTHEGDRLGQVPATGETVEHVLELRGVRAALGDLPETYRRALVLRGLEGRSHVEIGRDLGISAPQAKALIHRARLRLRQSWRPEGLLGVLLLPRILRDRIARIVQRLPAPGQEFMGAAASAPVTDAAAGSKVAAAVVALAAATVGVGTASVRTTPPSTPERSSTLDAGRGDRADAQALRDRAVSGDPRLGGVAGSDTDAATGGLVRPLLPGAVLSPTSISADVEPGASLAAGGKSFSVDGVERGGRLPTGVASPVVTVSPTGGGATPGGSTADVTPAPRPLTVPSDGAANALPNAAPVGAPPSLSRPPSPIPDGAPAGETAGPPTPPATEAAPSPDERPPPALPPAGEVGASSSPSRAPAERDPGPPASDTPGQDKADVKDKAEPPGQARADEAKDPKTRPPH